MTPEPAQPAESPEARADTVAFVQEWLENADYDPTQFDRDFAAAIDARAASTARPTERGAVEVSELSALRSEFIDFARYLRNAPANPLDEKREVSVRMILAVADALPATDQAAEVEKLREAFDERAGELFMANGGKHSSNRATAWQLFQEFAALATQPATGRTMGGEDGR